MAAGNGNQLWPAVRTTRAAVSIRCSSDPAPSDRLLQFRTGSSGHRGGRLVIGPMANPENSAPPAGSWQQQRAFILQLGQRLWEALPSGEPPITVHGRDLRPDSEGVGFQFQLTMQGPLCEGRVRAVYYVVQVQLVRRTVSLGWLVDAMPVLEIAQGDYDLYPKRSFAFSMRQRTQLALLFDDELAADATRFFVAIRNGDGLQEPAVAVSEHRATPVLQGLR
jgi:hypothetical protein